MNYTSKIPEFENLNLTFSMMVSKSKEFAYSLRIQQPRSVEKMGV